MKSSLFFTALAAVFIFAGCTKDKEAPVVSIESPLATETYVNGDSIHIHGDIEDNEGLVQVTVRLINTSQNDTVLYLDEETAPGNPFHFHGNYVINVPIHSDLELYVTATDEAGNEGEDHVFLHILQ